MAKKLKTNLFKELSILLKIVFLIFFANLLWSKSSNYAPVAQLDRVPGYEPGGQRFESSPVQPIFMNIKIFVSGPLSNNTYLITCEKTKKSAVIDPAFGSFELLKKFVEENGLKLEKIFLTHSHFDHIADCAKVKDYFKAKVYIHKADSENLKHPSTYGLISEKIEGVIPDIFIEDKDEILIGEIRVEVISTSGHSAGSVCYYVPKEKALFSGDTLFKGTYGKISLPTSRPELMLSSLKKLAVLPPQTIVYPGHGRSTTIADEKWLKDAQKYLN